MIATALTKMFGLTHPIMLAPMGSISGGHLAAVISNAGALGLVGGGYGDHAWLRTELSRVRENARRPWGVGLITWSIDQEVRDIALGFGPAAFMLAFGDPRPFAPAIKAAGCRLICQVQDVDDARLAQEAGADIIVAQGSEAGGHGCSRATLPLVPAVVDAVAPTPVVAAGGIADGRGLAPALMLGAHGVLMGTRFCATVEALGQERAKQRIVAAQGNETARTRVFDTVRGLAWPAAYTGRALRNSFMERWNGREGDLTVALVTEREAYRTATREGDYDTAVVWAGEGVDLIKRVAEATRAALERLRASGRHAILVTGRRLDDLLRVCGCSNLFDYVVAENGAVLYEPQSRDVTLLAEPPPEQFVAALRRRGVQPLEVGKVIVATHAPQETQVIETIRELGLELQVIFNREAVMVLPAGINKASGTRVALRSLGMSPHEMVAVGDAENDHSFMRLAECPVAVANAVNSIKAAAAFVTAGSAGDGVIELIDELIANDLAPADARLTRRHIALGTRLNGSTVWPPPYGVNVLVTGPSGSGKSTFATGLIERLAEHLYQVCVIDPEGDYVNLPMLVTIGDPQRAPGVAEIIAVLRDPDVHANANLLGIALADRPAYFATLVPHLRAMRVRTGRPHWLIVDEAHHLLPRLWGHVPQRLNESLFVTVHPERLAPSILECIDVVIAVGAGPDKTLREFAAASERPPAELSASHAEKDAVACWFVRSGEAPFPMRVIPGQAERIRHYRKYAEGDVRYKSFYFRGPTGKHNLKAQNLNVFCQIAEGIGEETWMFHLRRNDYSRWMRDVIKNEDLAAAVEDIERRGDLSPAQTRALVRAAVETRYTLPE